MNWNEYVLRRRIDVQKWILSKGISTKEQLISELSRLGIDLPNDEQLATMFPTETKDESVVLTPEGVDPSTTRSLVTEGDGTSVRPDGKRTSKVSV